MYVKSRSTYNWFRLLSDGTGRISNRLKIVRWGVFFTRKYLTCTSGWKCERLKLWAERKYWVVPCEQSVRSNFPVGRKFLRNSSGALEGRIKVERSLKEQYPVTVNVPNFDFLTGCREFKRCMRGEWETFETFVCIALGRVRYYTKQSGLFL